MNDKMIELENSNSKIKKPPIYEKYLLVVNSKFSIENANQLDFTVDYFCNIRVCYEKKIQQQKHTQKKTNKQAKLK